MITKPGLNVQKTKEFKMTPDDIFQNMFDSKHNKLILDPLTPSGGSLRYTKKIKRGAVV